MFININSKREHEPDLVLQVCNPSYMGDEAEGHQFKACMDYKNGFKASLGNSVRPYLKSKEGYSSNSWQSICLPYTKSYLQPLKMKPGAM